MTYIELRRRAQMARIPKNYTMNKVELSLALGLGPVVERQKGGGRESM